MCDKKNLLKTEPSSFLLSRKALGSTLIRLALVAGVGQSFDVIQWIKGGAVQSILVDPVYLFSHVEDAVAIRNLVSPHSFVDAYQSGQIYLPPLLLSTMEALLTWSPWIVGVVLIAVDYWIARNLEIIGQRIIMDRDYTREDALLQKMSDKIIPPLSHIFAVQKNAEKAALSMGTLPKLMAAIYYLSPVTVICSSVLLSFQNFPILCLTNSLVAACQGSLVWSAFSLAMATYTNLHYSIFLIPLALLVCERQKKGSILVAGYAVISLALQGLSLLLVGPERFLAVAQLTHGRTFVVSGIAPSLSTLWYLGMELFHRFSVYTTILVAGAPYLLIAPLYIRLSRYPEVLVGIFWLMGTLFRPPGTLFSLNIGCSLLLLAPRSLARIKSFPALVALCGMVVPIALYLVTVWLWLEPGSGEANFCFFQCLAYNIFVAILLVQFCSASLRRDKASRVTEKGPGNGDASH